MFILFFSSLVSPFSSFLSIMAGFEKVKDVHEWLVDCEAFKPKATRSKVDSSR